MTVIDENDTSRAILVTLSGRPRPESGEEVTSDTTWRLILRHGPQFRVESDLIGETDFYVASVRTNKQARVNRAEVIIEIVPGQVGLEELEALGVTLRDDELALFHRG